MGISILIFIGALCLVGIAFILHSMSLNEMVEVKDGAIPLEKVFPIQCIENNFIINGNGDITAGYEIFLPEVFTLNLDARKQFMSDLEGICKMLPSGCIIHQQLNFYTEKYENKDIGECQNYILKENLLNYEGRQILQSVSYIYITFTDQGKSNLRNVQSSLLRKKNIPFTQPYKDVEKRLNEIEGYIINFEDGLMSMQNLLVNKMDNNKLNNKIYDFINCSYDTPTTDATNEVVSPMFVTDQGELKVGENYVAILSLVEEGAVLYPFNKKPKLTSSAFSEIRLPKNIESKSSMTFPLGLGLPFSHTLNVVIEITDNDKVTTKLTKDGKGLNPIIQVYPPAAEKKNQLERFCDMVTKENLQTSYTAVNIIIKDKNKESLQKKVSQGKNAFQNMNHSTCFVENLETANLFFACIPGNARANYRGFVNTIPQALSYIVKESLYLSDADGYIFSDRFGKPCVIDLNNTPHIKNKGRILIGPSGAGKSYWLNNYILQSFIKGHDVMIVDIGGSYKSMIALNGGKYYDSRDHEKFSFNPFLCPKNRHNEYVIYISDSDDTESKHDIINFIITIISVIWKPKKDGQLFLSNEYDMLTKIIVSYYKHVNEKKLFPSMDTFYEFLEGYEIEKRQADRFDKVGLILALERYTTIKNGEYGYLLNAKENIDIINDSLIAFDLESVFKNEETIFPIIIAIVLNLINRKISLRKGIPKQVIIDEGFDFLEDEKMGLQIASLYRTIRKKEGGILLAAQNCKFIDSCPKKIKESILLNADTKILLDHSTVQESFKDLQSILSITDDEIEMLKSLQNWEFYVKLGKKSGVFRNDVSPVADAAFDSKQKVQVEIQRLFNECGSTQGAINQYIENQKRA